MTSSIVFVVAVVAACAATAIIDRVCRAHDLFARREPRAIAHRSVPRLGGIALALAFFLASLVGHWLFDLPLGLLGRPTLWLGSVLVIGVGVADDVRPIPAQLKLAALVAAGFLVAASGLVVERLPFIHATLPPAVSIAATCVWVAALITAWNFIDGLDGLASGFAVIAALAFWLIGAQNALVQPIAPALAGVAIGFLAHNRPPARIFMGDGGAFFVGFWISVLSLHDGFGTASIPSLLAALVVLWPIGDLVWAFSRRCRRRQLFRASADHFHYLLSSSLGHRRTVLAALLVSGAVTTLAVRLHTSALAFTLAMAGSVAAVILFCARVQLARRLSMVVLAVIVLHQIATARPSPPPSSVIGSAQRFGHAADYLYQAQ